MPTVLEVDASQKGLGACLTQHGKPIASASKSFLPTQKNYSNIERETLEMVFGIARFHNYLFGKEFVFPVVHRLRDTKSATVVGVTSRTLGMFGAPAEIISDNFQQFVGAPHQDMCASWGISHITSSPRYPQSNGFVERSVRTVKALIKRCQKSKQNVDKALLNLRATPIDSKLPYPAEILFGRPPCISLPSRRRMKADYDRRHSANELPPLHVGQKVRILDQDSRAWLPAEVTTVCRETRSCKVATPNGSILRRTRSPQRDDRYTTLYHSQACQICRHRENQRPQ
ncbi:uncharacterized protein LOC119725212 [Patiria miniata]|uniref:Integrase catalytic domain-containing protein n=1 Tax=Patiria miniata TaxID=46514 RepID=A0A913ZN13_PATMI|nr:uncharacterized protein LOC119721779 [Patiria miniata]XP_038052500.1 uncharacterized protein LOC119725209 [Patiria miniata]XP_038052503.1 uncharacterized protein LOC119725212 [Patiria miniata]